MYIEFENYSNKSAAKDQFLDFIPRNFSNISCAKKLKFSGKNMKKVKRNPLNIKASITLFL